MKVDEDLGHDRNDEFQTDDEENQAETIYEDESETGTEDSTSPLRSLSNVSTNAEPTIWPQSYRVSMDMLSMTPPSILRGTSVMGIASSLTSIFKRHQSSESTSVLSKPLLADPSSDKEEFPISIKPVKLSASSKSKLFIDEFPTPGNKSSFAQAVINGINVVCGITLLATPYSVKEGGWLGLLIFSLFGVICCYTGILLKKCLDSSPGIQTYPDIGQAAFGRIGRIAISIVLYLELYAASVEFVILMGDNLSKSFPNTNVNFAGVHLDSHQIFTVTATLIVLPTVWLRDLSLLSYLSVGGVGASMVLTLCLLWIGVVDKVGFHPNGTAIDIANLPLAVGIFGFGYAGHALFPNIHCSMEEPSRFTSVLIISFIVVWFINTGVAICGFLIFGNSIKSQFTLNMPKEFVSSKIAIWTTVVTPMAKYALTITPVALSLEEIVSAQLQSFSVSVAIRTILVISNLVVALTVPFFGNIRTSFHHSS
uniref:Vacuolar amino acid transporter 1 n=1 Tax=Rhizophora mucronata TaxID=61149 RepID=A0A2P2J6Z2_RHIMU